MASSRSTEYIVFQANFDRLVNVVSLGVEEVARKAFVRNLISVAMLNEAENWVMTTGSRASQFLQHIIMKIEENPHHFYTFISILKEIPRTKDVASELEQQATRRTEPADSREEQNVGNTAGTNISISPCHQPTCSLSPNFVPKSV